MASVQDRWFRSRKMRMTRSSECQRHVMAMESVLRVRYRTPAGDERARSFSRKADADRFAINTESSKLEGTFVDPARSEDQVRGMAAKWRSPQVRPREVHSIDVQERDGRSCPAAVATGSLGAVEFEDVQAWIAELVAADLSGAHVRKIHFVLAGVMQLAVKSKRLSSKANPAKGVELPRAKSKEKKYLNVRQVETMAKAAGTVATGAPRRASHAGRDQYRLAIYVLAYCGLRWSEIAAMRVYSVDLLVLPDAREGCRGRGRRGGPDLGHAEELRGSMGSDSGLLVDELRVLLAGKQPDDLSLTSPEGEVMRNRNARRAWFDRAAKQTGVAGSTPHELRHTAASLAVKAGANVKALQRMLGHASAAITLDIYADLFDDDLDAVAGRLDALRLILLWPDAARARNRRLAILLCKRLQAPIFGARRWWALLTLMRTGDLCAVGDPIHSIRACDAEPDRC